MMDDAADSCANAYTYIHVHTGAKVNAVTWGVFPGREIVQPTVVDAVSFGIWKVCMDS